MGPPYGMRDAQENFKDHLKSRSFKVFRGVMNILKIHEEVLKMQVIDTKRVLIIEAE